LGLVGLKINWPQIMTTRSLLTIHRMEVNRDKWPCDG
jgi:hypothetical protein